jgi:tripartite-type tricarboxylate transporter receptor subunit TctC
MKMRWIGIVLLALGVPLGAWGQAYPSKPVKLIVADGPGSVSDLRARQIGAKLGDALGQPVVIENRPGGSMVIAAEAAARAAPDGYTLFLGNVVSHSINPSQFRTLPYRPDRDFVPVTLVTSAPLVLVVNPGLPVKNLEELIALARAQPGKMSYGVIGQGSPGHIVMEQLKALRGAHLEFVPYKSTAQYVQDLVGGHLQVALNFWPTVGAQVKAGKIRALAVTGPRRLEAAPDVPTFAESGLAGFEAASWQGLMVPAGTPPAVVARLHREVVRILQLPEIRDPIVENGSEIGGNTPEEFAAFIGADRERWKRALVDAKIEPN